MATGLNVQGIQVAQQNLETWIQKVENTINNGSSVKIAESIKGTQSQATAKQAEEELKEMINQFFTYIKNDLGGLEQQAANYQRNDEGNTTFSNLSNSLKS